MPETRERILHAAMELFHEKGYTAAGMSEILARAEANSGSFYYYFDSKEDLLVAVLVRYEQMLQPALLAPAWKGVRDPMERVFALLALYRRLLVGSRCAYGCPIGRLALEVDAAQTAIHRRVAANFTGWKAAVERCLRDAQRAGQLPASADAAQLASLVLSVMEGGVMQARSYGSVRPFDESVTALRRYFQALGPQPARAKPKRRKR